MFTTKSILAGSISVLSFLYFVLVADIFRVLTSSAFRLSAPLIVLCPSPSSLEDITHWETPDSEGLLYKGSHYFSNRDVYRAQRDPLHGQGAHTILAGFELGDV